MSLTKEEKEALDARIEGCYKLIEHQQQLIDQLMTAVSVLQGQVTHLHFR